MLYCTRLPPHVEIPWDHAWRLRSFTRSPVSTPLLSRPPLLSFHISRPTHLIIALVHLSPSTPLTSPHPPIRWTPPCWTSCPRPLAPASTGACSARTTGCRRRPPNHRRPRQTASASRPKTRGRPRRRSPRRRAHPVWGGERMDDTVVRIEGTRYGSACSVIHVAVDKDSSLPTLYRIVTGECHSRCMPVSHAPPPSRGARTRSERSGPRQ